MPESTRQLQEVSSAFSRAHELGLVTVLWCYQVANCYLGRSPLINSGGAFGENDMAEAVRTAVMNKRAGGMGLISGRKAFQRPMKEGLELLNAIQVYLDPSITIA